MAEDEAESVHNEGHDKTPEAAIVIAGPTASGKSALAVRLAGMVGGEVVNADSMQVYDILQVITARPDAAEMGGIRHHLFGHVSPSADYSVAAWLEDVGKVLPQLSGRGAIPIFAGGTGLYFRALLQGLSLVPPIDPDIRAELRQRADSDPEGLLSELEALDQEAAQRLKPADRQRVVRALEVHLSTGRPLSWWQAQKTARPLLEPESCLKIVLEPGREIIRERIAQRFHTMIANGAGEEVARLVALDLPNSAPAMRAIGVGELAAAMRGEIGMDEAIERAISASRQYAKRQSTWFRTQFGEDWLRVGTLEEAGNACIRWWSG